MRVDPAIPHAPPAAPAAAPPSGGAAFAAFLGGENGDLAIQLTGGDAQAAAAAAALIMQPPGASRDQQRAEGAFSFGVFGLFPPGYAAEHGFASDPGGPGALPAAWAAGAAEVLGAAAGQPASAAAAGDLTADDPAAAKDAGRAAAPALPSASQDGEAERADGPEGVAEAPFWEPFAQDAAPAGAPRTAANLPIVRPPPRTAAAFSLLLSGQDGRLSVVAAGPLDPADHAEARARLRAAAGPAGLDEIQINGWGAPAPPAGGGRHGGRTR